MSTLAEIWLSAAVLKSSLLRQICKRSASQQALILRRSVIFAPLLITASERKCFHTASADFCLSPPAAMDSSLPIMVTKRAGQIECKWVVKWSVVFQLVFQLKIKFDINAINQHLTELIQITPAHHFNKKRRPRTSFFVPETQ